MKKKALIISGIAALLALLAVPFAFAQRAHRFGMHRGGDAAMFLGHLQHAKEELGLSDAQVDQIKTIFKSLREQNRVNREAMRGGMANVAQLLIANPNDLAGAQALIDQQTANERAMKINTLNAVSKALNVLTPEQRTKLGEHVKERMERIRER